LNGRIYFRNVSEERNRLARCIRAGLRCGSEDVDSIIRSLEEMGPDKDDRGASRVAKALSDPIRVAIVRALGREEMLCVCELMHVISRSQPSTSHHLRILREAGVVDEIRKGKWVFYKLIDESVLEILDSLQSLGKN